MTGALERVRGGLIVSVQAYPDSLLATPATIALLARVAEANGAAGVRVEGVENLRAVRAAVALPIVGIIKRAHAGFAPYITSTPGEVADVAAAGAEIVAFDATLRPHAGGASVADLVAAAHAAGLAAMADCSCARDGEAASDAGADALGTTLAGYTDETKGVPLPALELVRHFARIHPFAICEGGIADPDAARAAFASGARAIVVGTAITNVDALVRRFAETAPAARTA